MKVICIDAKYDNKSSGSSGCLVEGNVYTVVGESLGRGNGIFELGYVLKEGKDGWVYQKRRFIPLSTIDETELLQERQKQLA